ncbi:hypothetical protein [Archangium sp.]|uniref:hypothetical protein n=1 Tax=Archangium sp. TaxID=1872627 RepID=UPI00389B32C9
MPTRSPTDTPPRPQDASEHDLRVQLEGTWEVLEQARDQQAALLERLTARDWLRRLREQPELLRRFREQEGPLGEALERAERRLQKESSPEHHPLRVLIGQLRVQRASVESRVRMRLTHLGEHRATSFLDGLARLEAEIFEPPPRVPGKDETVLVSGGLTGMLVVQCILIVVWLLAGSYVVGSRSQESVAERALFFIFILSVLMRALLPDPHRYWLTPRRLVWKQFFGGMKQMPLESLRPDGITRLTHSRNSWTRPLRGEGKQTVTFSNLQNLDLLEALLRMHTGPPLRGRVSGPPTYTLAMFPATRRSHTAGPEYWDEPGLLVMRSGHVAFLPDQGFDDMLRALFGTWPTERPAELSLPLMMQQLCLLPAEDFDRCLATAVRAGRGELWAAARVTHGPVPSGRGYQFTVPQGPVLTGYPEASQHDAIGRVVHHWPHHGG